MKNHFHIKGWALDTEAWGNSEMAISLILQHCIEDLRNDGGVT